MHIHNLYSFVAYIFFTCSKIIYVGIIFQYTYSTKMSKILKILFKRTYTDYQ